MTDLTPYVPSVVLGWQRAAPEQAAWVEQGALAFIDVSGFTAMSERLGKLGREGGEVVTDVIGSTFDRLLAVAYEAGGSLLKFGGDALLLWFGGGEGGVRPEGAAGQAWAGVEGAARRACFAAARMRATLRTMGAIPTPMGGVRVRVSAGVHAGTFQFFVVGSAGKELVVAGPGATRTVEMESAASAGEILVSPETAHLVRRWCGDVKGPGVLLRQPPPVSALIVPSLPDPAGVDVPSLVATAVRRHLLAGEDEPEHRHAAVGFVHFDGTDGLIERVGPDVAGQRLGELVSAVQAACDEHGVALLNTDVDKDGGKFLLSAGAPEATADEDERMLRTLRAIIDAGTSIPVRAGTHRGLVFAGSVGPRYRRSYTLMGDVVNTAARVMAHARPGQLLATADVLDRTRTRFSAEAQPPFAAKGKARPLVTYDVGRPVGIEEDGEAGGALIGRVDELWALTQRLDRARAREGGLVEVTGEPGIGKSRLAGALRAEADKAGAATALVRATPYESATPYFPFRALLRQLAGVDAAADGPDALAQLHRGVARLSPELVADEPLLAAALGLGEGDEQGEWQSFDRAVWRSRLHRAVAALLDASFHRAFVLVAEDGQWLDDASVELLRHLGRSARTRAWLVVVVRRADEGAAVAGPGDTAVALGPLDRADMERLLQARSPVPLLPTQARHLITQSDGNPLFLEQLVAAFDPDSDVLPERLEELVASRIDQLPARQRSWLRQLSVLGGRFDLGAGGVVLGVPALREDDLGGPLADFIAVHGEQARFRQHVFQSVAYAGLSFRRRRELHERAALHLEAGGEAGAAVLATHFDLADRFDRSWQYGRAAGDQALVQHAYLEAASLYRLALRAAGRVRPDPSELRTVWQGLGDALRMMGRLPDAVAPYRMARRLAGDDLDALGRLCFLEADLRRRLGQRPAALRWITRARAALDGRPLGPSAQTTRIRLLLMLGGIRFEQGRLAEAERILREGLAEAEAAGDRAGQAHACLWLAYTLSPQGKDDDGAFAERALRLFSEVDAGPWQVGALNSLAGNYKRVGRWADAADMYARAKALAAEYGDPAATAVLAHNLGELLVAQGRVDDAVAALTDAVNTFAASHHAYAPVSEMALARAVGLAGDHARAEAMFSETVPKVEAGRMATFAVEGRLMWAELRAVAGDAEGADDVLAAVDGLADPLDVATAARIRGVVASLRGQADEARARFAEAVSIAKQAGGEYEGALAVVAAARYGVGEVDPDIDLSTAELVLARLGVVATPQLRASEDPGPKALAK